MAHAHVMARIAHVMAHAHVMARMAMARMAHARVTAMEPIAVHVAHGVSCGPRRAPPPWSPWPKPAAGA